jgi:hypothetical protein
LGRKEQVKKKGNGRDSVEIALFQEMLTELRAINARLERVEGEVHQVKDRLEHVLVFVGERYRDHDERLKRIETKIFGT